jgi:hypothetical protein
LALPRVRRLGQRIDNAAGFDRSSSDRSKRPTLLALPKMIGDNPTATDQDKEI